MTLLTTKLTSRTAIAALLTTLAVLAGCEKQGPAEASGEAIDDAARDAAEKLEDAGERIQNCVDNDGKDC